MYNSLAIIKKHLNIDSSFTEDDQYLTILEDVAEKTVQRHICCVLSDMEDIEGKIPSPLCQAILLYVGVLYNSRESIAYGGSPVEVPYTYEYLIGLYKNYADTTSDDFVYDILSDLNQASVVDTAQEQEYGNMGDLVIPNVNFSARSRILSSVAVDENGTMTATIERI